MEKKLKQLKFSEIKEIRDKILKEQNGICPICKTKIKEGEAVLDHKHKTKNEKIGENGAGLIRGVLCQRCNSVEGMLFRKFQRMGIYLKDFPQFLRNLADYLEREKYPYIHPKEAPKTSKLGKRAFNKLQKFYSKKYPKRKKLIYPKSGKLTKKWQDLLKEFDIQNSIK